MCARPAVRRPCGTLENGPGEDARLAGARAGPRCAGRCVGVGTGVMSDVRDAMVIAVRCVVSGRTAWVTGLRCPTPQPPRNRILPPRAACVGAGPRTGEGHANRNFNRGPEMNNNKHQDPSHTHISSSLITGHCRAARGAWPCDPYPYSMPMRPTGHTVCTGGVCAANPPHSPEDRARELSTTRPTQNPSAVKTRAASSRWLTRSQPVHHTSG